MSIVRSEYPFINRSPCAQNAVDLFESWASRFPEEAGVTAGQAGLFDDPRVIWADQKLKEITGTGFEGKSVVELGPLEGGHSFMLSRLGVRRLDAVEANAIAFLKCLVAKEILGMPNVHFLLGDAVTYLAERSGDEEASYDIGFCCGFLYHLTDPVGLIRLLSLTCRRIYLWTITHHPSLFEKQPAMAERFGPPQPTVSHGFAHTLHPHFYGDSFKVHKFLGGTAPQACWMTSADIVGALRHFGFTSIIETEEDNPYGVALSLVAAK
jgi:hypothetical protein